MAKSNHPGIKALEQPERSCRRWRITISLGWSPELNRYDKEQFVFHGTLTEAKEAQAKRKAEIKAMAEGGINPNLAEITFEAFSQQWLRERELCGDIAKGTIRKNKYHLSRVPAGFNSLKLTEIRGDNVKRMVTYLRSNGGEDGSPLSGTTARNVYTTVKSVLNDAVIRDAIASNPCAKVKPPKADTAEKEPLSRSEARELAEALLKECSSSSRIGFLLALTCGLRREEICGLRWCDFDPKAGCIRVRHALPSDGTTLDEPKSEASKRIIPLSAETLSKLAAWKLAQAVSLESKLIEQKETTPVCSARDGGFMHPQNLGRSWGRYAKSHNLEGYSLHQLRHTYATTLVASGVDIKTASVLMGHSGTAMLEKVYAHLVPENAVKAASAVGNALFGEQETANVVMFSKVSKAS